MNEWASMTLGGRSPVRSAWSVVDYSAISVRRQRPFFMPTSTSSFQRIWY